MDQKPGTTDVIRLTTNEMGGCPNCPDRQAHDHDHFINSVNHQLKAHGRQLIHIGTETSEDDQGRLWSHTVAYLAAPKSA